MVDRISIVTPTLNQGRYIADTINSVLSQTGNFHLEYFILDGGSTDSTVPIISAFARDLRLGRLKPACKKMDFWWWSGKDGGQAEAIIQGFNISSGWILNWLNSDDYYYSPRVLSQVLRAFHDHPAADIVVGNIRRVDAAGRLLTSRPDIYGVTAGFFPDASIRRVLRHSILPQPGTFFRRSVFDSCGIDPFLHYSMDWDLWIKAYRAGCKFFKLNDFLANERVQPAAKTVAFRPQMYREFLQVYTHHHLWPVERLVIFKQVVKSWWLRQT